jgi:hypothetical protein
MLNQSGALFYSYFEEVSSYWSMRVTSCFLERVRR